MDTNNMVLNRIFTKNTFVDLINDDKNVAYFTTVKRYLNDIKLKTNKVLISEIYDVMTKNYRNEYFYKNTLLNKLLLGRHSLRTTTALSEVSVSKSKADFILINGKATVYEIKTELDTFDRLENQLNNYFKAFNNVCVITSESNYNKINNILDKTNVGISILTEKNTISIRKKPIEDNSKLDYKTMFNILNKKEFENILLELYGDLPQVKQVEYYTKCFELFKKIEIGIIYKYFLRELKKRNHIEIDTYNKYVPYELRCLMYFSKFKTKDYIKLNEFLESRYGG